MVEVMEVCELYKIIPKEKLDYLFQHSDAGAEMDCTYLGFEDVYKRVLEHVPKEYTILDLGCAYACQSWFFRDHAGYIGVDGWGNDDSVIHTENSRFYFMTIQDFVRDVLPTLGVDLEKVFAVCSAVPDWNAQALVKETFSSCLVWYPGEDPFERFPFVREKEARLEDKIADAVGLRLGRSEKKRVREDSFARE